MNDEELMLVYKCLEFARENNLIPKKDLRTLNSVYNKLSKQITKLKGEA